MVLRADTANPDVGADFGPVQDLAEVERAGFPVIDLPGLEPVYAPGHFLDGAETHVRHDFAQRLGHVNHEVYYVVARVVDGVAVRYVEKWTEETTAVGALDTRLADSHLIFTAGSPTTTVTGLAHLEGEEVVVWGNTKDLGTYTVASGQITVSEAVTWACIGLSYEAYYVSGKLTFKTEGEASLEAARRVTQARLILKDTHQNGLEFGSDEDNLDALPPVEDEAEVDGDYIWSSYDTDDLIVNSEHSYNQRLVLRATAPRACTVLAAVITLETK